MVTSMGHPLSSVGREAWRRLGVRYWISGVDGGRAAPAVGGTEEDVCGEDRKWTPSRTHDPFPATDRFEIPPA
jgi:hypothetical protein